MMGAFNSATARTARAGMSADSVLLAGVGAASFICVLALMPVMRSVATRYGVTDEPAPGKLHQQRTPYLGGVAVALVVIVATPFLPERHQLIGLVAAAVLVAAVGLVDDIRTVSPMVKVAVEVLAA